MRAKIFGGDGKGDTPVPIPNTEVKTFCADGTAWAAAWESRSPPITSLLTPVGSFRQGFSFFEKQN